MPKAINLCAPLARSLSLSLSLPLILQVACDIPGVLFLLIKKCQKVQSPTTSLAPEVEELPKVVN
jgi:hypothetical protein